MDRHFVEYILAVPRMIVHAENVQQSRFARPRRTHDRDKFPRPNVEIDTSQDKVLRHSLREILFDVAQCDHWTSVNPLSRNSFFASSISRRFAPVSSSTIKPSNKCTMRSACCA